MRAALLTLLLAGCRADPNPVQTTLVSPSDAAPPTPPSAAVVPPAAPAPFTPPRLALEDKTTDGPKGPMPALGIVPSGFPALSADGGTYAYVDELDYYGHTTETAVSLLDVKSGKIARTVLARARDQIPGSMDPGSFPPTLRKALGSKLESLATKLDSIQWTQPNLEPFYASRANPNEASSDWELVRALPDLQVSARWNAAGAVESVRIAGSAHFEGLPQWSGGKPPQCGYEGAKHVPDEVIAVTAVGPHVIVLAREWRLGTHDCDGVPGAAALAFVTR